MPDMTDRKRRPTRRKQRRIAVAIVALLSLYPVGVLCLLIPALWRVDRYAKTHSGTAQKLPVSDAVADVFVAAEDSHFYRHHGVDWDAMRHAIAIDVSQGDLTHGGSTLTMQTARYSFLGTEKTILRKSAEIPLALYVDRRLSKRAILKLYLETATFGLHTYCIQDAARVYFGTTSDKLSLAQAGFLAGALSHPPPNRFSLTPEFVEKCKLRALLRLLPDTPGLNTALTTHLQFRHLDLARYPLLRTDGNP
jgi:membrane carboxypeptidase/penicillin-binding protein PbpC